MQVRKHGRFPTLSRVSPDELFGSLIERFGTADPWIVLVVFQKQRREALFGRVSRGVGLLKNLDLQLTQEKGQLAELA